MKFKKVVCEHCSGTKQQPIYTEEGSFTFRECPWCVNGYIEVEDKELNEPVFYGIPEVLRLINDTDKSARKAQEWADNARLGLSLLKKELRKMSII